MLDSFTSKKAKRTVPRACRLPKMNLFDILFRLEYNKYKEYLRIQERIVFMNLAKISANGQITVPAEVRRLLGLKSGDKILFFQKPDGEIVVNNASTQAIYKVQKAFAGVAEELGLSDENDVQNLVNQVRYGK